MSSTSAGPPEAPAGSAPPVRRYRWAILAAGVFAQAAFSAILLGLPAVAPAIQDRYGLTLPEVGVVLAAINFGSFATLLPWGLVADRIGERAVIVIGQTGAAAALLLAGGTSSYGGLVAALAAAGAVGAGVNAASGRAVMHWFGAEELGLALGIRQMAVPLGGAIAAGVLPTLETHVSLRASFVALAAGCLGAAVLGAVLLRAESGAPAEHGEIVPPLRDRRVWRLCFGSTFYVTTQLSILAFFVLFLHGRRGLSTGAAAGTLAATQVLGAIARVAVGRWSDRVRARVVPLRQVALALSAAVGATALLVDAPLWLLVPTLVGAGTLSLSWNGLSFTAAAEAAGRTRSGAAIGLQQTFLSAGSIVAPIGFAAVVHSASWRVAFVLAALSPLAGYALLSPLSERRP